MSAPSIPEDTKLDSAPLPCTWQDQTECRDCIAQDELMCRLDWRDTVTFLSVLLPFAVTTIAGTIRAGYGRYRLIWLAFALFLFFVWEARILCSHCPYWAGDSRVLHCHANAGVVKLWRYRPGPMSRWEQAQFIIGAGILLAYPLPFLILGREYLLAAIAATSAACGAYLLRKVSCSRCINFSCPMNTVPKRWVDAYLRRNPVMRTAWEASGYVLGEGVEE